MIIFLKGMLQTLDLFIDCMTEDMDGLIKNVRMLLDNPGFAKVIMENQKKAAAHSTWKERLQNILEQRFEEGKDFI